MKVSKIAAICILVIVFSFSVGVSLLSAAPDMTTDEFKAQIKGKIDFYSYPRLSKINGWARDTNFLQYFDANTKYVIYLYLNVDFSVSDVEFRRYGSSEETIRDSVAQDALKKLKYTVQVPTLTEIVVSPPAATLNVDDTMEFKATVYNQNGEVMGGVTVTWSSTDSSVGTIDANGLFTADKVGGTTIVAESGDIRGTASVMIPAPSLSAIEVLPSAATLNVGDTMEFKATAYDQNHKEMRGVTVTWSSTDSSVGTIDANNGLFTAKKVGETTIVVKSGDIRGTASVSVTEPYIPTLAPSLSAIKVLPPAATLNVDDTMEFKATAYDQKGKEMEGVTVTWSSTDSSVGTIDANNGLFTAKKVGETTIVAKSGDIRGTASVSVTEPYIPTLAPSLSAIKVLPPAATLNVGDTMEFEATAYDQKGKEMKGVTVTWSSTDSSVGTIDPNNGLFTAKKVGETTIEAKSGDIRGTASVSVTEPYIPTLASSLSAIKVLPSVATLNVGDTMEFKATAYDQKGKEMKGVTVTWSSTDSSVGTIDANNGLFTAKKVGETTIVVKSGDIKGTASVSVTEQYIPTLAPSLSAIEVLPLVATLNVGDTMEFKATAYDQKGKEMKGVTVTWSSTDSSVGTIDANNGLFTAKKVGETTIEAKNGDIRGTASVSVTEPYIPTLASSLSAIKVLPLVATLNVGDTMEFKATAYDQKGKEMKGVTVTWSSTDSSVGTIDANSGLFTAKKVGETTIEAKSGDIRGTASVSVTEQYIPTLAPSLSAIEVSPPNKTLNVGDTMEFKATAYDQKGKEMKGVTVTWSSTDSSVGTIDANGLFTAKKVGKTTIVAKKGDKGGTASVGVRYMPTIKSITDSSVSFNNPDLIIKTLKFHNDAVSGSVTLTRYYPSFLIDIAVPEELGNSSGKIIFRLDRGDMKSLSSDWCFQIFSAFDTIINSTSIFSSNLSSGFSSYDLIKGDVKLLHESGGGWTELPTKPTYYTNRGDRYWEFEAYTPNFSRFIVKMEKTPVTGIFFVVFISLFVAVTIAVGNSIFKHPNRKKVYSIITITIVVIVVIIGVIFRQFLMLIMLIVPIVITSWWWHKEKKRPLFDWVKVLGDDESKFKDFFINYIVRVEDKDKVKLQTAGDVIVIKDKDTGKEYAEVKILNVKQENDEDEMKTKATITLKESGKSYDLKVKNENGKQNIYWSLSTFIRTYFPSLNPDVLAILFTIAIMVLLGFLLLLIAYLF